MCPIPALEPPFGHRSFRNGFGRRRALEAGGVTLCAIAMLIAFASRPAPAASQVVEGRLLDSATKKAVVIGRIALLDTTLVIVDQTYADETGEFTLKAPRPGAYYVAADRPGYFPRVDGLLELGSGGKITIEYYLKPRAVAGEPIHVVADAATIDNYLRSVGFHARRAEGSAYFMTQQDVERAMTGGIARLLAGAPGARVNYVDNITTLVFRGGSVLATDGSSGTRRSDPLGFCSPRIIVDGVLVNSTSFNLPGAVLDGVVSAEEIVGVEVHSGPASMPLQFSGTGTSCTTVLFWTTRRRAPDS